MNNAANTITTASIENLLGVWALGSHRAVFSYSDETHVRLDHQTTGLCRTLTAAEAQGMLDGMRESGWRRPSR